MRRPLKPFVTEYKGANRRQSPASQPLKIDAEPFVPRQLEPRPQESARPEGSRLEGSRSLPPPQEDGYEAALRAADALFAPPPRPAATPVPAPAPRYETPPDTQPAPQVSHELPPVGASPPPANGGRILRVIDEPPSPELLRLEAERAPKRRGRKPGSKNKPKTPALVEAAIPAHATALAEPAQGEAQVARHVAPVQADADQAPDALAAVPARVYRLPQVRPVPQVRPAAEGARDEKYAWVRTKLKPGERWKRRLPKVAW